MYYLNSKSCHVMVCHIFLKKYISTCFPRQRLVIAISTLKQLIILEHHIGVYHKGGRNANGRTSIFDVSHDFVKKFVFERKQCFSSKCNNSDIDIDKLSFQNPSLGKLSPVIPSQNPLCIKYSRYFIRSHLWFHLK